MNKKIVLFAFLFLSLTWISYAETVHFKNGDTLTGNIVEENEESIFLSHDALGTIEIKKDFVLFPESNEAETISTEKKEPQWKKKISGGYSQSGGNTEISRGVLALSLNKKTEKKEWSGKISSEYASSGHIMNARKFYGLIRYAYSLEEKKKWYYFHKLEGDQDYFANIYYRFIPSLGLVYWFVDSESFKVMAETAFGCEYTKFRDDISSNVDAKVIPRFFLEKVIKKNLRFNQEFVFYLSDGSSGGNRIRSQSALINKINANCDLAVRLFDDYNSSPAGSAKKNDYRLMTTIDYLF